MPSFIGTIRENKELRAEIERLRSLLADLLPAAEMHQSEHSYQPWEPDLSELIAKARSIVGGQRFKFVNEQQTPATISD